MRLVGRSSLHFENRAHFFAVASSAMRQILVNHAKGRLTAKRGGARAHVSIDDVQPLHQEAAEIVALNDALEALQIIDERKSKIVEMRYFGGYSDLEIAETLGISDRTVQRDWEKARLILAAALR